MGQKSHMQEGFKKGAWTTLEDQILKDYIGKYGEGKWNRIPKQTGLKRCGKSCRLRWLNYLRPGIKRGHISQQEEDLIIRLQRLLGNRWSLIAGRLPGRTDNEIKNYWNTTLKKKLQKRQYPSPSEDGKMKTTEETWHDETPSLDNSQLCGSKDEQPLISTSGHGEMDWKWMDELSPVTCSNYNFGDLGMDGFDECSFDFSPFLFPEDVTFSFDQI